MTTPRPSHPTPLPDDLSALSADELVVGELTAALVDAERSEQDALPPALAERLVFTGEALVRATRAPVMPAPVSPSRRPSVLAWTGWLAAAALLAITVVRTRAPKPAAPTAPAVNTAALDGDVRLLRATIATDTRTLALKWTPGNDSTGRFIEDGEVLWSPTLQKGVMRLIGLMPNDSTQWQYQLWIFDKTRDERYPVDGGVFNIAKGQADRLVPIRARVPVGDAIMFAITVEKPGGVVVSTRERLAMLAKL
ncbi:MAG: anti-sigma factor [Gemmatimonadaceae bacterium]|nr:anti-sigma factor [Gemmatimonadaceae bacterium]